MPTDRGPGADVLLMTVRPVHLLAIVATAATLALLAVASGPATSDASGKSSACERWGKRARASSATAVPARRSSALSTESA